MPTIWCCILLTNFLVGFFVATVAQGTCRLSRNVVGVCKPYKECNGVKDRIIFPDDSCEPDTICCPDITAQPTFINNKLTTLPLPEPAMETPKVTQVPRLAPTPSPTPAPSSMSPQLGAEDKYSFDDEFYRRLALTFGERYNIIVHQNEMNLKKAQIVLSPADERMTTTTTKSLSSTEIAINFEEKLHPLGLEILRTQKCGFVYASIKSNASNIEAEILEFPWMALLKYKDTNGSQQFACGGSLVTERWVLTAAHCIRPGLIGVRLGEYEISENSKRDCTGGKGMKTCTQYTDFKISTTIIHSNYEEKTGVKNIALIKLRSRAGRSKNIKPICLPTQLKSFAAPYDQKILKIAGWGLTEKGFFSNVLKKHTISLSYRDRCKHVYPELEANRSKMCLSGRDEQPSTCSGDPGGPIFWLVTEESQLYTQIGIVPLDMKKCGGDEGAPYYAESVADSMDWITQAIGES